MSIAWPLESAIVLSSVAVSEATLAALVAPKFTVAVKPTSYEPLLVGAVIE